MVFYHSDSLATVLVFLFLEIYFMECAISIVLSHNYSSKARNYSPVNLVSVYRQYSSLSLAERNGSGTTQWAYFFEKKSLNFQAPAISTLYFFNTPGNSTPSTPPISPIPLPSPHLPFLGFLWNSQVSCSALQRFCSNLIIGNGCKANFFISYFILSWKVELIYLVDGQ